MNQTVVIGNLGGDAESRFTQTGQQVTNFRMASNRRFTRQNGETDERTEWHRVTSWNQAGACSALKKGQRVMVIGELQTRSWNDKDGNKRFTTDLVASHVAMVLPYQRQNQSSQEANTDRDTSQDFDDEIGF